MAKGRGRGSGAQGSRLGPHQRVSGDEAARQRLKVRGGGELRHERGGREGRVACGKVRHGLGAFYRCRGGAGRPDGEGNQAAGGGAPLWAIRFSGEGKHRR
jgi:hypothetical protein